MATLFSRVVLGLIGLLFAASSVPSYADTVGPQELEQMVAPIALYPDPLLSQVLIAATYPIDVVEAARWRAGHPEKLSDQQLAQVLQPQPWDPSVKSLVAFPDVLEMMDDNISWTSQLGETFLDQQDDLMAAVQRLRVRAQAAGNLRSGPQQTVLVSGSPPIIVIQPALPETIYVPVYNPLVIYGAWPYPQYPPYYWHSPRYAISGPAITFTTGFIAVGVLWSSYNWQHRRVDINVNRYNRFNHTHITDTRWRHDNRRSFRRDDGYRRQTYRSGQGEQRNFGGPRGQMPDRNINQRGDSGRRNSAAPDNRNHSTSPNRNNFAPQGQNRPGPASRNVTTPENRNNANRPSSSGERPAIRTDRSNRGDASPGNRPANAQRQQNGPRPERFSTEPRPSQQRPERMQRPSQTIRTPEVRNFERRQEAPRAAPRPQMQRENRSERPAASGGGGGGRNRDNEDGGRQRR